MGLAGQGAVVGRMGRACSIPALLAFLLVLVVSRGAEAAELVMFESADCPWCAAWDRELGEIYPKTEEARRAPLRRVDIHATRPNDLEVIGGVVYTPTFVLFDGCRELGRIVGYPGEDFFWGLLDQLLAGLADPSSTQQACAIHSHRDAKEDPS